MSHYISFVLEGVPAGYTILSDTSKITSLSDWTVYWGDDTYTTCSINEKSLPTHRYSTKGDYTITIEGDIVSISAIGPEACPIITNNGKNNACLVAIETNSKSCLREIGGYSFYGCAALQNVNVKPELSLSIGESAFKDCGQISYFPCFDKVTSIGNNAFANCTFLLKDSQTGKIDFAEVCTIGEKAFSGCWKIRSLSIGERLTQIGTRAFENCKRLSAVEMKGEKPTSGDNVFYKVASGCRISVLESKSTWSSPVTSKWQGLPVDTINDYALTYDYEEYTDYVIITGYKGSESKVIIPSHIAGKKVYSVSAFKDVQTIRELVIPDGVEELPYEAFSNCSNLQKVVLPNSLKYILAKVFFNCGSLSEIKIPSYVQLIGSESFVSCRALTEIEIPQSVITIEDNSFLSCYSLRRVTLHEGLESIGENAFSGCSGIEYLTIPESVTSIRDGAFSLCSGIKRIDFTGNAPEIGYGAFDRQEPVVAYVKLGTTGWPVEVPGIYGNILFNYRMEDIFDYKKSSTSIEITKYKGTDTMLSIPSEIEGLPVVSIGDTTFKNSAIKSVYIPSSVTSIGTTSFYGCTRLDEVVFEGNAPSASFSTFTGCKSTCTAIVSENAKGFERVPGTWKGIKIDYDYSTVFSYSEVDGQIEIKKYIGSSPTVRIPAAIKGKKVTKIADTALSSLYNADEDKYFLEEVIIADGVKTIGKEAFAFNYNLKRINLPYSLTSIGEGAFRHDDSLTSLVFPYAVTRIDSDVCRDCENLRNFKIKDTVTSIGEYAFSGCSNIKKMVIPESVVEIGVGAFQYTGVVDISLPSKITTVSSRLFESCPNLMSVTLTDSIEILGEDAFAYCEALDNVRIPPKVSVISSGCFHHCYRLKSVVMSKSVAVGSSAFYCCNSLESFAMPDAIGQGISANIGSDAFYRCTSLKNARIHESCTSIGRAAFNECSSLKQIVFEGNAPTLGTDAFKGVPSSCHVYVHAQSTGWGVEIPGTWNGMMIESDLSEIYQCAFYENEVQIEKFLGEASYDSLDIPDTIMGKPVTCICKSAFEGVDHLRISHFPSGLKKIGERAFYGVDLGPSIIPLPSSLMIVGDKAFLDNHTSIGNVSISFEGDAPSYGYRAFGSEYDDRYAEDDSDDIVNYRSFSATVSADSVGWEKERQKVGFPYSGNWHGVQVTSSRTPI